MARANTSACSYSCGEGVAGLKSLELVPCGLNWTDSDLKSILFLSCALVELMSVSFWKEFWVAPSNTEGYRELQGSSLHPGKCGCWKDFGVQTDCHLLPSLIVWAEKQDSAEGVEQPKSFTLLEHRCSEPGLLPALLHPHGSSAVIFLSGDTLVPREVARSPATEVFNTPQITLVVPA